MQREGFVRSHSPGGGSCVCGLGSCRVINSATLEHCKTITPAALPEAGTQPLI